LLLYPPNLHQLPFDQLLQAIIVTWPGSTQKAPPSISTKMTEYRRLECLFCKHRNPSYAEECGDGPGLTVPTTDENNNQLSWTFYAFGSEAPASKRTIASF